MLDTGTGLTACPRDFAIELGSAPSTSVLRCEAATGDPVVLEGTRRVALGFAGTKLHLDFQVANVKRPIVSAHGFYDAGFTSTLGASSGCALSGPSG